MAGYPVETCRGCRSTERASMMYSLSVEDTRKLFSECTRLQLPNAEEAESQGQLCAPCYEYCEGWFEYKTMCWNNNAELRRGPDLEGVDELSDQDSVIMNGFHDEITIESEDYDCNGYDDDPSVSSSPMSRDKIGDDQDEEEPGPSRKESSKGGTRLACMYSDWQCPSCEVTGKNYTAFRDHFRDTHCNGNFLMCPICDMKFTTSQMNYCHVFGVHMGMMNCPHCQMGMPSFDSLKDHIRYNHMSSDFKEPIDWTCPICKQSNDNYYDAREHLLAHLEGERSSCPICEGFVYISKVSVVVHIMNVHMNARECRWCGKRCSRYTDLRKHFLICPRRRSGIPQKHDLPVPSTRNQSENKDPADTGAERCDPNLDEAIDDSEDNDCNGYDEDISVSTSPVSRDQIDNAEEPGPLPKRMLKGEERLECMDSEWQCPSCEVSGRTYEVFRDHFKVTHVNGNCLACPICDMTFSLSLMMYCHVFGVHMGMMNCPHCQMGMPSFDSLRDHIRYNHISSDFKEPIDWTCPICKNGNDNYYVAREHLLAHLEEAGESWSCPICKGFKYNRKQTVVVHIMNVHMDASYCSMCDIRFKRYTDLRRHFLTCPKRPDRKSQDKPEDEGETIAESVEYDCNGYDGEISVSTPRLLRVRKAIAEEVPEKRFSRNKTFKGEERLDCMDSDWQCPCCEFTVKNYELFRDHFGRLHLDGDKLTCPVCDMKLSRTVDVYYHIAGVHMGKLDCPKCHKRMSSFDTFRKHIDYCHPADNFKEPIDWTCPICSQNQGDYYEFREHLMTAHLAGIQETWSCPLADHLVFDRKDSLIKHIMSSHMSTLDCRLCGKRCAKYTELRTHFLTCPKRLSDPLPLPLTSPRRASAYQPPQRPQPKPQRRLSVFQPAAAASILQRRRHSLSQPQIQDSHYPVSTLSEVRRQAGDESNWDCPICGVKFTKYTVLRKHLRKKHVTRQKNGHLNCPICKSSYCDSSKVYAHILKIHMKKWDCPNCGQTCGSTVAYELHLQFCAVESMSEGEIDDDVDVEDLSSNEGEPFQQPMKKIKIGESVAESFPVNWDCCICGMTCDGYLHFRNHILTDHPTTDNDCPVCAKQMTHATSIFAHVLRQHMMKFDCPVCYIRLDSFNGVNLHMTTVHNGSGYDESRSIFYNSIPNSDFNQTVENVIANWENWSCVVCKQEFRESSHLRSHMYCHIDKEFPACPQCNQNFSCFSHTFRHVLHIHMRKWNCLLCPFKAGSNPPYIKHVTEAHNIYLEYDVNSEF